MKGTLRLLLIDDNPDDRLLTIRALRREFADLEVEEIADEHSFMAAVEAGRFDAAITDYSLGWADGLEVLRALKARYPDRPVTMFTRTGNQELAVEAMKAGLDDYVVKSPQHFVRVSAALRRALEHAADRRRAVEAEHKGRRSDERFRLMVEGARDFAFIMLDQEGRVTEWLGGAEALFGYHEGEIVGEHASRLFTPKDRQAGLPERELEQAAREGRAQDENWALRKDGCWFWASGVTIALQDGEFRGFAKIVRDRTERRRMEAALRANEEQLRLLAAQLPAYVWTTDTELRLTSVLGTGLAAVGLDAEQLLGRTLSEVRGTEDAHHETIAAHLRALDGTSAAYETRFADRDLEARVEPLQDASGAVIGCVGVAIDVTERRWTERRRAVRYRVSQVLAEAPSLEAAAPDVLRAIGEGMGWDYGALWVVDGNTNVLRCVETWHISSSDFTAFITASRATAFAPGEGLPGTVWMAGTVRWVTDTAAEHDFWRLGVASTVGLRSGFGLPISLGGRVIAVIEFLGRKVREPDPDILVAITAVVGELGQFMERVRAQEELQVRARQQSAVAELGVRALASPDLDTVMDEAILVVARTLDVEYCKLLEVLPGDEMLLLRAAVGYNATHVGQTTVGTGRGSQGGYTLLSDQAVISEDLRAETRFEVPPLLREYGVVSTMSVVIPGRLQPFGVLQADTAKRRVFTTDDANFLQAVANVLATAIRRRDFEEQLARERTEASRLEELDRLREQFIASISHDLKTPLTAIGSGLGLLQLSMAERLRLNERGLLENARRNADRLRVLIDGLLAYNQLEVGTLELRRELIDLRTVVTDAMGAVHLLTEGKGQSLEVDVPEPLPVNGDAFRLGQVVINLLANAHAHTPSSTRIAISGRHESGDVLLIVSDNGPGIPLEQLESIFERSHRLDPEAGGSGLGLAIARGIVELHGGRIWAESKPGQSSRFCIALPAG